MDWNPDRREQQGTTFAPVSEDFIRNWIRYGLHPSKRPLQPALSKAEMRALNRCLQLLFRDRKRFPDEAFKRARPRPRRRAVASRLSSPPGIRLRALAEFTFSAKSYLEIFVPVLRDLFDEHCQALMTERPWKARWVLLRGYWSFWSAVAAQMPISIIKKVYQIWKAIP